MEFLHTVGIDFIQHLQKHFKGYDDIILVASHLGDPRNAFLIYFPIAYCLHKKTGVYVLWLAILSEWLNAIAKWVLHGERPFWWVKESLLYEENQIVVQQYKLTCETGPGSPSGHAMVTASVVSCLVMSLITNLRPRFCLQGFLWVVFVLFMLAVTVSRIFIATHFPHQVVFGTSLGIILTLVVSQVPLEKIKISHCIILSLTLPLTCFATFYCLKVVGLDPQWSITLATKHCVRPDWVHLDTTLFNSIYRDAGSVLGYGLFLAMHSDVASRAHAAISCNVCKLINTTLCLLVCQVGESVKPSQDGVYFYYFFTFVKFCGLVYLVMFISSLFNDSYLKKQEDKKSEN